MDNFNLHKYYRKKYMAEAHDYKRYDSLEKELRKELDSKFGDHRPSIHLGYYSEDRPDNDPYKDKGYGDISFLVRDELSDSDWKKALDWVKSKGFDITSESNWYEMEWDGDRAWYPKIKFEFLTKDIKS
jgi:hypothetical protein